MHKINRRKLMVSGAIGAAAVSLGSIASTVPLTTAHGDDKLRELIRGYKAEVAAINASGELSDEELDAWMDRADAILIEAVGLPVLTAASAVVEQHWLLTQHSDYGDGFLALVKAARNYIAAQGGDLGA
jgi:hypothetical protein